MKKNLIVKQDGHKECGAASLLSIIRYYHGNISMSRLLELTCTDKFGTNFYQLKKASEQIGLEAIGYQVDEIMSLKEIKKPFICQVIDNNYEHFIVIYAIKKDKVVVMDPAIGERILKLEELAKLWTSYILIFSPKQKLLFYKDEKYLNKMIIETIQKNKSIVLNILLLSIIFAIISCFYALYFQVIMDYMIDTTKTNLLAVTFIFSILLIVKCITSFFRNELLIYLNQKMDYSIFINTFQKLLLLPYNYYKNRTTGEIVSRINDLVTVKNILNKIILTVFLDVLIFVCCGSILFSISPIMFLILILIMVIYILIFYIFRPILKKYININQQNNASINSILIETISGFETIKNMHMESTMKDKVEELYIKCLNQNFTYENICNLELFLKDLISLIGILLVEFLGFSYVIDGILSLGKLLTFASLTNYFIEPIKNIVELSKEYYYALNSIKRVNHLFETDIEKVGTNTNFVIEGNIQFCNLSFSYNAEKNILQNINFTITRGNKVMILGSSGSGKSTLLKLLLKYYTVARNSIYIDGIDLNDYTIDDIRENLSCISQNEFLYTDTIKNNITLRKNIPDKKFIEVCRMVYVDDFVKKMFLGYHTKLEENGLNLSGGQRQRIMLARMLLKESQIMLIDEGLNAIDINLERQILKNIFSKYINKTIIVVSHRLENIDLFDQVIKLENGYLQQIKCSKEKVNG